MGLPYFSVGFLAFSMKYYLEKGPSFDATSSFLIPGSLETQSSSPKCVCMLSAQLRQSLMALSVLSHGGGDSGLALTTRLLSCGFLCSFSPPFYQP